MNLSPKPTYVEIIIVHHALDKFKEFWNVYGDPISLIAGGFAAGFAALFFDKLKAKRKHRKRRNST